MLSPRPNPSPGLGGGGSHGGAGDGGGAASASPAHRPSRLKAIVRSEALKIKELNWEANRNLADSIAFDEMNDLAMFRGRPAYDAYVACTLRPTQQMHETYSRQFCADTVAEVTYVKRRPPREWTGHCDHIAALIKQASVKNRTLDHISAGADVPALERAVCTRTRQLGAGAAPSRHRQRLAPLPAAAGAAAAAAAVSPPPPAALQLQQTVSSSPPAPPAPPPPPPPTVPAGDESSGSVDMEPPPPQPYSGGSAASAEAAAEAAAAAAATAKQGCYNAGVEYVQALMKLDAAKKVVVETLKPPEDLPSSLELLAALTAGRLPWRPDRHIQLLVPRNAETASRFPPQQQPQQQQPSSTNVACRVAAAAGASPFADVLAAAAAAAAVVVVTAATAAADADELAAGLEGGSGGGLPCLAAAASSLSFCQPVDEAAESVVSAGSSGESQTESVAAAAAAASEAAADAAAPAAAAAAAATATQQQQQQQAQPENALIRAFGEDLSLTEVKEDLVYGYLFAYAQLLGAPTQFTTAEAQGYLSSTETGDVPTVAVKTLKVKVRAATRRRPDLFPKHLTEMNLLKLVGATLSFHQLMAALFTTHVTGRLMRRMRARVDKRSRELAGVEKVEASEALSDVHRAEIAEIFHLHSQGSGAMSRKQFRELSPSIQHEEADHVFDAFCSFGGGGCDGDALPSPSPPQPHAQQSMTLPQFVELMRPCYPPLCNNERGGGGGGGGGVAGGGVAVRRRGRGVDDRVSELAASLRRTRVHFMHPASSQALLPRAAAAAKQRRIGCLNERVTQLKDLQREQSQQQYQQGLESEMADCKASFKQRLHVAMQQYLSNVRQEADRRVGGGDDAVSSAGSQVSTPRC